MKLLQRLRLIWRILKYKPGGLLAHAKLELGESLDPELEELIMVFSTQGHSGHSAQATAVLLDKLLQYEPIGPLTGEPEEWMEVSAMTGHNVAVYQNRRLGRVFKQSDRFNGQAYDSEGIIWIDKDGSCFTNYESLVPITFPYTPHKEYRHVPEK